MFMFAEPTVNQMNFQLKYNLYDKFSPGKKALFSAVHCAEIILWDMNKHNQHNMILLNVMICENYRFLFLSAFRCLIFFSASGFCLVMASGFCFSIGIPRTFQSCSISHSAFNVIGLGK